MDKLRPYITAALLCEKVLQEKDESLTVVRIADKLQYALQIPTGDASLKDIKPIVNVQGLVSIKSGPVTGDHTIKIAVERPNGERKEIFTFPVKFLGKDHGQNIILNMGLGVDQDGFYWFDVLFDDEVLTRIPLQVMAAPTQTPPVQKT